jgi:ribonuclease HI
MELVAVLEALKALKMTGLSVAIYTDSQLVIGWLTGANKVKADHIAELVRDIKTVVEAKYLAVDWYHVKGHNGNAGNTRADQLARKQAREVSSPEWHNKPRCLCAGLLNHSPHAVPNPDCPLHGAGFAHWEV